MRIRSLVAAAVVGAATFAFIPAASATTEVASDPTGDTSSSYADINAVGVTYSETTIGVGLFTVKSWSPDTWGSGDAINWVLDVDGDSAEDFEVWWTRGGASVYKYSTPSLGPLLCSATTDYTAADHYYFAGFPASCIGTPASVRVRGYINLGYTRAYDFAPSYKTFSPAAFRDIPPPPTQPPPTTPDQPQPDPRVTTASNHDGYWMLAQDGTTFGFGSAQSLGPVPANAAVHIEPTPSGNGYWVLDAAGNVTTRGDAQTFGVANLRSGEKAVSLSASPTGKGYWVFTDKGRVAPFGDAQFYGDVSGLALNGPVLGSVATPSGHGYWMVGSDGGIFSFGDATFHGSTGGIHLNKPVMSMAPAPDGSGYWLVASDGGIFAFDVPFYGSMGAKPLNKPISGMVPGRAGYMMVAQDGGIFSFGSVAFHGSMGANPPSSPVVSVALQP